MAAKRERLHVLSIFRGDGFASEGIVELRGLIESSQPLTWRYFPPTLFTACYVPGGSDLERVRELLLRLDAARLSASKANWFGWGVSEGEVFLEKDSNDQVVSWPMGTPMSESMKQAASDYENADPRVIGERSGS